MNKAFSRDRAPQGSLTSANDLCRRPTAGRQT